MRRKHALLPEINLIRCICCGACIAICPTRALGEQQGFPWIARSEDCTLCAKCEDTCPCGAIEVPFNISWAANG